ncbi:MAG: hypothetical protein JWR90_1007 [Marmoricola sp.]|nr:hypothetical protein [Marmoricola sp.]
MPPTASTLRRLAAPLLVAVALALVAVPATATTKAPVRATAGHSINLAGDTGSISSAARAHRTHRTKRASFAWTGRRITYTESVPAKWDWSLSTAIAKWNATGGGIKFVKVANPRKAKLAIGYGNIGSAAGLATVGRAKHAKVQLNSSYANKDALNAYYRVQVMGIFTHELGHVLGFQHTSTRCSLMSPVLDVEGCGMLPATMPGYYKCRTIDPALASRFVQIYGGRAHYPSSYCLIDPLPAAVSRVAFDGGASPAADGTSSPVTVRWARPTTAPAGSRVEIWSWNSDSCGPVPPWATTSYAAAGAGSWTDPDPSMTGSTTCYRVQLVNRYGAGRTAVSRLMSL